MTETVGARGGGGIAVAPEQTWGTSQLVEFLGALSGQPTEETAARAGVERVIEALDADIGMLLDADGEPEVVVGLLRDDPRTAALAAKAFHQPSTVEAGGDSDVGRQLDGADDLRTSRTASVALSVGERSKRLVVVRVGDDEFLPADLLLLRGMAWVLDLTLRQLSVLTQLNERQRVLERLGRVQRDIASRVPLPEVFDAVTDSALALVGSQYALLHLFDRAHPTAVSVSGVPRDQRPAPWLLRVSTSVADYVHRNAGPVRMDDPPEAGEPHRWVGSHPYESVAEGEGGRRRSLGAPVRGENGVVVGSLVVISPPDGEPFTDNQEQALLTFADQISVALSDARGQLAAQHAVRDPVTGLPNRVLFLDQLESALSLGDHVHVMFIDLDKFKFINDTLGHAVGDELLRQVGRRLRDALRGGELLARFGGDEFAVLLANATDEGAGLCAQRLLTATDKPYRLGEEEVNVGCSIGIAPAATTSSAQEVMRNADAAMYQAKRAGGGRLVTFDPGTDTDATFRPGGPPMLDDVAELRQALERPPQVSDESPDVRLVYQPILDLRDGSTIAVEALVRWNRPGRGELSPAEFLPLAEQTGLIVPLGRRVLAVACGQAAAWALEAPQVPRRGPSVKLSVSVNISARQLRDPGFVADVRTALSDAGLPPERLILDIAEAAIVNDQDTALEVMLALRDLGVRMAIDDFGTGASALSSLRGFPLEMLKIDRSLVEGVTDNWQGRGTVQTVVRLAQAMSVVPVAIGVETQEQVSALLELNCRAGQGYLFGRPMPAGDVVAATDRNRDAALTGR